MMLRRRDGRRVRSAILIALAATMAGADFAAAQQLLPDIVPWVREDAPYLVNWDISAGNLRVQTMFANIGDGLFQIRTDSTGSGATIPVTQRVFQGLDNGPSYTDYFVESTFNFHQEHGHIHFDNFSEFLLLESVIGPDGIISVGSPVAETVKSSYRVTDSARIPDAQYANRISYPSSNTGLFQNISVGWGDVYSHGTAGQSISLAGVPAGPLYWLRQVVDPLNVIREKNDANNSTEILIDLNHPGEAILHFGVNFVRPGDLAPPVPGDLTGERIVDIQDWLAFKASADSSLAGLDNRAAWLKGDFNLDRKHTLGDVVLFRQYYEDAVGPGSFAAIEFVPEPATGLLAFCCVCLLWIAIRRRAVCKSGVSVSLVAILALLASALTSPHAYAEIVLFSENFDGLTLGPNIDESVANPHAWTDVPPAGWTVNDSGVPYLNDPARGVREWKGWSFADKAWWSSTAGDQNRSQFALGSGTIAVADPDEWDDKGTPLNPFVGYYSAFFTTPAISLTGAPAGQVKLAFSSSWRPECCDDGPNRTNNQTATVRVSYNGGATFSDALRWDSIASSATFKPDATNEAVTLSLNNPAGAATAILQFGLSNAGNDWWWAVDNIAVYIPTTLEVDVQTGRMKLVSATQLTGYEITSVKNSLNPLGWQAGNLDAQNLGSTPPLTADFDHNNRADGGDFLAWQRGFGRSSGAAHADGDADGNQSVAAADLAALSQQLGQSVALGDAWESVVATNRRLLEFALTDAATAPTLNIGQGYDTLIDGRDLAFTYTTVGGAESFGVVRYVNLPASLLVPESSSLGAGFAAAILLLTKRPSRYAICRTPGLSRTLESRH